MIDKTSDTWLTTKADILKKIEALRDDLEKDGNDVETAKLRGEIKGLRAVLALGEERKPLIVPVTDTYGTTQL